MKMFRTIFLTVHVVFVICVTPTPKGHLKPLGSHPPLHSIPVMEEFPSPEYFYQWFVKPSQPVLFKSVLKSMEYPAYRRWTDDYLREHFGDREVTLEIGKKETRNEMDSTTSTFSEFLDRYHQGDLYMVFDDLQQMKEDIPMLPCIACGGYQNQLDLMVMWFSSGGTRSVLHHDSNDNINCLLDGTKDMIFIDKIHNKRIEATNFVTEKGYSKVDIDNVDLLQYPHLQNIPWISAHMTKGDCLFIPSKWYHQVNSYGNRNLAINVWFYPLPWFNQTDCKNQQSTKASYDSMMNYKFDNIPEEKSSRFVIQEQLIEVSAVLRDHLYQRLNNGTRKELKQVTNFLSLFPKPVSEMNVVKMTKLLDLYFKYAQRKATKAKEEDKLDSQQTRVKDEM